MAMANARRRAQRQAALTARARNSSSTFLLEATVQPRTAAVYRRAMTRYLDWAAASGVIATDEAALDSALVEYFHEQFDDGAGKSLASSTLNGLVWLRPEYRFQLPRASQAQRGWHKLCPGTSYPPLTWELTVTIGVQLARGGNVPLGIGVLLAFDCLLRVSELVALRREDVLDSTDSRMGFEHNGTILMLRRTKTGANKSVTVLDPAVIVLLRALVARTRPGERLFPFTAAVFRRALHSACASLGLSAQYVPHSLRHGGATRYFHVLHWSMEHVMDRGRWASTKSARIYIQSGAALAGLMTVPTAIARIAVVLVSDIVVAFSLVGW
jgi:integrase